ncbi:MAG: B12-binding domain-containing radical SAM protein [Nitrososphaerota archaeon]|jgi:magnesium-protoporphyrin IX monomethyl ester (oxidative) cyclase|nr:B12-binding domain-containing radical SAM protein [Nitrososphaerota archaeon]
MHVCLINPPRIQPKAWGKPSVYQPMDISYVAAVLEQKHEVLVIDVPNEGWELLEEIDGGMYRQGLSNAEIGARIERFQPKIVVISVPYSGWFSAALAVAKTVKSVASNLKVALIGLHPSSRPNECLTFRGIVDFVVIGEPELTVCELADVTEHGTGGFEDLKSINGLGFIENDVVVFTQPRGFIEDLDSLPFPARHLLPMKEFFEAAKKIPISGNLKKPSIRMLTARGCPYGCVFCSNHITMGRKWRARSAENVVAEIEHIVRVYGKHQIDFLDDNIAFNRERIVRICNLLIEKRLNVEWCTPNGVRADALDAELLSLMRKAGCKKILIAPESGVQRVVNEVLKKRQDLARVADVVCAAHKVGIKVGCFFILGVIGETKEDIRQTIAFAYKLRQLGAEYFYFSYATPLYGTELYRMAIEGNYLVSDFSDDALSAVQPLIETPEFTVDDLRCLAAEANLVNPTVTHERILRALRNPKKALEILLARNKIKHKIS